MRKVFSAAFAVMTLWGTLTAYALDRRVIINNQSDSSIVGLWASNVGTDDWEEQILNYTIPPGEQQIVNFNDGSGYCLFDFRAKLRDGRYAFGSRINVCEALVWTVYDK